MCTGYFCAGDKSAGAGNLLHTVCNAQIMSERITPPPLLGLYGVQMKNCLLAQVQGRLILRRIERKWALRM